MADPSAFPEPLPSNLGKYEIRKLLGTGSMGMVFLARDPILERDVAIKVMAGASVYDEALRERFEREAKAVAQLHHPNIVTVHDLGYEERGSPFIAMELLEGTVLDELVETDAPPLGRKLDIIRQVCRGLAHAHRHGIVHRDIKPANVLVSEDGTAKIMDFGVARWAQSKRTQSGFVVGTAGYMSPEQLRGQSVDGRTDLFSLGVVLFEILTHEVLFPGEDIEAVFFQTLTSKAPALIGPDAASTAELQRILDRALAKDPTRRFSTADEMERAIDAFTSKHPDLLGETRPFRTQPVSASPEAVSADRPSSSALRSTTRLPTPVHGPPPRPPTPELRQKASTGGVGRSSRHRSRSLSLGVTFALLPVVAAALTLLALYRSSIVPPTPEASGGPSLPPKQSAAVPPKPLPDERAATLVADAALALGSGDLDRARSLIETGERVDPDNPRWGPLRDELREQRAKEVRKARSAELVGKAERQLEGGDVEAAITSYREALEQSADNPRALRGLDRALVRASEQTETRPTIEPTRRFVESDTTFIPGASDSPELLGFINEEGLDVKETADPLFPAKIILELEPKDARPGEPYLVRVSVFNEGYRPVELRGLELVTRIGEGTTGRGQDLPLRASRVPPQATVVVHEVEATWREAQNHGAIEATVHLSEGGKLTKTLRW